jgi:hypothetical protein
MSVGTDPFCQASGKTYVCWQSFPAGFVNGTGYFEFCALTFHVKELKKRKSRFFATSGDLFFCIKSTILDKFFLNKSLIFSYLYGFKFFKTYSKTNICTKTHFNLDRYLNYEKGKVFEEEW